MTTGKDVDGFTSRNLGNLVQGVGLGNSFVPCTPLAVLKILQNCIPNPDFMGKNACVVGRSHNGVVHQIVSPILNSEPTNFF